MGHQPHPSRKRNYDIQLKGHRRCSAVTYKTTGPHNWVGHCHCESCRRDAGAPLVKFIGHPNGEWRWTGTIPTAYVSTAGNTRYFCPNFGNSVAYTSNRYPNETHFHATPMTHSDQITPTEIYRGNERLT